MVAVFVKKAGNRGSCAFKCNTILKKPQQVLNGVGIKIANFHNLRILKNSTFLTDFDLLIKDMGVVSVKNAWKSRYEFLNVLKTKNQVLKWSTLNLFSRLERSVFVVQRRFYITNVPKREPTKFICGF